MTNASVRVLSNIGALLITIKSIEYVVVAGCSSVRSIFTVKVPISVAQSVGLRIN